MVVESFSPVSNAFQVVYFYQGSLLSVVGQYRCPCSRSFSTNRFEHDAAVSIL